MSIFFSKFWFNSGIFLSIVCCGCICHVCLWRLGWCDFFFLSLIQNPQADYGSMSIPEQCSPKLVGHSMHQFFAKLASKNQHFYIVNMAWKLQNYKIIDMSEWKVRLTWIELHTPNAHAKVVIRHSNGGNFCNGHIDQQYGH